MMPSQASIELFYYQFDHGALKFLEVLSSTVAFSQGFFRYSYWILEGALREVARLEYLSQTGRTGQPYLHISRRVL